MARKVQIARAKVPKYLVKDATAAEKLALANKLVDAQREQTQAPLVAAQASQAASEADATGRSKLLAAIPWVIGGVVALVVVVKMQKKRGGG